MIGLTKAPIDLELQARNVAQFNFSGNGATQVWCCLAERFDDLVGCLAAKRHDKRCRDFQVWTGAHLGDRNRNIAQRRVP